MLVFGVSPLIRQFILVRGSFLITAVTIPVCFFLFPRTFDLWPSVVPYFFPLFVLGAIMSYHYERIQGPIARGFWLSGLLAVACMAVSLVVPYAPPKYFARHFNVSVLAGLQSVLSGFFKVFLALFFWGLLVKCERWQSRLLDLIATYSFGIYFVHSYFLVLGLALYSTFWPPPGTLAFLVTLAYCYSVPLVSLGISMLIKRLAPRYSRYIAGV
jgi:membrane-bound acyltransferase YfiQ involved in biofilm formation